MVPRQGATPPLEDDLHRIGLPESEARVYLCLLSGPKTKPDIAAVVGGSLDGVTRSLTDLARRGFVRSLPGRKALYGLTPPDRALAPLVNQETEKLRDLHRLSERLTSHYESAASGAKQSGEQYVEIVFGVEAVLARLDQEVAAAETEVVAFSKPPTLASGNPSEETTLHEGVSHRAIYERELLEDPLILHEALQFVAGGEEARVLGHLPAKMVIIDRKLAIMNVTETSDVEPLVAGLITRHPEVVETLHTLFETLWRQALPLGPAQVAVDDDADRQKLVACLLSGMTDEAMSKQLGVSRRTVTRRVQDLLNELGVETRFQAGFKVRELSES